MVYSFNFEKLPEIASAYSNIRKTIWETLDAHNMIIFILEGSCYIEIDSKKYLVKEGECFFVPKNKIYRRSPVDDEYCNMLYIHFDVSDTLREMTDREAYRFIEEDTVNTKNQLITEDVLYPKSYEIYLKNHMAGSSKSIELAKEITRLLSRVSIDNTLNIVLLFCRLLAELSGITKKALYDKNTDEELVRIPENLKKAILYIKENSFEKISIPDLAKYCCVSQSQLARYFKNATGKTPVQYINEYKLNRAKNMLARMPELSVKAIAETLGFDDQQYFSRLFSKAFGESPTEYRYRVTHFRDENGK